MASSGTISLLEAVGQYVDSTKAKDQLQGGHQELYRFIRWIGSDRALAEINAAQVGEFVERYNGMGTNLQSATRLQEVRRFLSFARKKGMIEVNLAQHVRIRKSKTSTLGKKASNPNLVELTPEGHAQMTVQLEHLKSERSPLAEQIRSAAADGDVRENAPLEAAREQLGHVESRIKDIETTLNAAVIIDPSAQKSETVGFGSKVVLRESAGGKETTYMVVRANEANPLECKISDVSPVGQALVGTKAGQKVQVETPRGKVGYEVVRVSS